MVSVHLIGIESSKIDDNAVIKVAVAGNAIIYFERNKNVTRT